MAERSSFRARRSAARWSSRISWLARTQSSRTASPTTATSTVRIVHLLDNALYDCFVHDRDMGLPLAGVTVVSCEQAVAAPVASRQLADLGARVIKVERPGGGDFARRYDRTVHGLSSHFVWLNRSKESVALDLKDDADRTALLRLIDGADVFLQNYGPGAAERLGLGAE